MKNYNYIEMELFLLLAKLHIISYEQIFQLFAEFDAENVSQVLNDLIARGLLSAKEVRIKTATEPRFNVKVFYLNSKSNLYIRKNLPLAAKCLREKCFSAVHSRRLYHDLLIVQALIYLMQYHKIIRILSEEELKSMRENSADLRLILLKDGEESHLDIEIVVTNNRKHIKRKSDNMIFFTPVKFQIDVIDNCKTTTAIHIDLVTKSKIKNNNIGELYGDDYEMMCKLESSGRALTAAALAAIMRKHRPKVHSRLKYLAKEGFIHHDSVQANPGITTGRRTSLFAISEYDTALLSDKLFTYQASECIVNRKNDGWKFLTMNRHLRTLRFANSEYDTMEVYIDDRQNPIMDEIKRAASLPKTAKIMSFDFADSERIDAYQRFKSQVHNPEPHISENPAKTAHA